MSNKESVLGAGLAAAAATSEATVFLLAEQTLDQEWQQRALA